MVSEAGKDEKQYGIREAKKRARVPVPVSPTITALHQAREEGGPCVHCGLPWDEWTALVKRCPKHIYGVNTLR